MSIQVTCDNGHKFTVGAEFLQKTRKCPKCKGDYSWCFRLRCSRGHKLKVPGKYAGQKGKCPQCGESVRVPEIAEPESAETLVSNLLLDDGNDAADTSDSTIIGGGNAVSVPAWQSALAELGASAGVGQADEMDDGTKSLTDALEAEEQGWHSRRCPYCRQQVDISRKSCSECGKYIGVASPEEIARSQRCTSCGAMSYPGAAACTACGIPFG